MCGGKKIKNEFNLNIPIYTLYHPVESENIPLFDMDKFIENKNLFFCRKMVFTI